MDPLPLIPEDRSKHEVAPVLRLALQDTLDGYIYPKQIAENLVKYKNGHELNLKDVAKFVLKIHEKAQHDLAKSQVAAADIMLQNALYLIEKDKIDGSSALREQIKLQRCYLFKKLEEELVQQYKLLENSDLLPSMIHQYLDFRNHEHTVCPACYKKAKTKEVKQQRNTEIKRNLQSTTTILFKQQNSFKMMPSSILFHNYELNEVYKKNVKIINSSSVIQAIGIKSFPLEPYFTAIINNNEKLAPGMSMSATITFRPKVFKNLQDRLIIKNKEGEMLELPISCSRDLPKLITCIFKSNSNVIERCWPGSNKFMEKRREALNSTIDCGSCLVSQYVLVSIILENKGMNGKFFFMTEDDWFFQNIETITTAMELFKGNFWIYPTYFEIRSGEVVEINIIFQPTKPGLHVETLYLICNNNAHEQIELMGDALEFSKSFIEIDRVYAYG